MKPIAGTLPPPFYANLSDETHCFQASFRMVLKYFLPEREFSWNELDSMSDKQPDKSTWPQHMLLELQNMGFDVAMIEGFDAKAFIKEGTSYLQRAFGEETSAWQIENSDIPREQHNYQAALTAGVRIENRLPELDEFKSFLDKGYLTVTTVNSRRLNHHDGYVGHAVVVFAVDEQYITFHDPGPPPQATRRVGRQEFLNAWADPNDEAKSIIAVKCNGVSHG